MRVDVVRLGGTRRPAGYGGCTRRLLEIGANAVLPGQALGSETWMREDFPATRAAILIGCTRGVANSARHQSGALGAGADLVVVGSRPVAGCPCLTDE